MEELRMHLESYVRLAISVELAMLLPLAPIIRELSNRAKWDYRGQRKFILLGQ